MALSATVTMTSAQPCVVTDTAHGFSEGQLVTFDTTGALYTGLIRNQVSPYPTYYAHVIDANTYNLALNKAGLDMNMPTMAATYDNTTDIFTATAHGMPVGTACMMTAGTMPTGYTVGTTYYVIGTSYAANTFCLSTTISGTKINGTTNGATINISTYVNTSGAQSGTHTRYNVGAMDNAEMVTMTIASPAVVTCPGHAHKVGDAVYFDTNGALPTGVTRLQRYFVISTGLTNSSYQFSATSGGSAVNTSGAQSGTHWVLGHSVNGGLFLANAGFTISNVALYTNILLKGCIPTSRVGVFITSTNATISEGIADANGEYRCTARDYVSMIARVRKGSSGTKYLPYEQSFTHSSDGTTLFVSQVVDAVA